MSRSRYRVAYVRLSPSMHRDLRLKAADEDRTINALVVEALKAYLRRPSGAAPKIGRGRDE